MTDVTDLLAEELKTLTPDVRARLRPALPMLREAIAAWQGKGSFSAPGLMAACATPTGAMVIHSNHWGKDVDGLDRATVLAALHESIGKNDVPMILASLTSALGAVGRAEADRDARIVQEGGMQPLLVVLAAPEGDDVSVLAMTVALPRPAEPSGMVH